jgi:hypothetical protein
VVAPLDEDTRMVIFDSAAIRRLCPHTTDPRYMERRASGLMT